MIHLAEGWAAARHLCDMSEKKLLQVYGSSFGETHYFCVIYQSQLTHTYIPEYHLFR